MRYHCVVPLLGAAANILICILVLRQGIRDKLHRAFAWMGLAIVSWNLDIFALYYFTDREQAEWWSRLFRTGICLAPPIVFHFALVLSRSQHGLGEIWLNSEPRVQPMATAFDRRWEAAAHNLPVDPLGL